MELFDNMHPSLCRYGYRLGEHGTIRAGYECGGGRPVFDRAQADAIAAGNDLVSYVGDAVIELPFGDKSHVIDAYVEHGENGMLVSCYTGYDTEDGRHVYPLGTDRWGWTTTGLPLPD